MLSVTRTAEKYTDSRLLQLSGGNNRLKLGGRDLRAELVSASMFGELSALERVMAEIVSDKSLTREDIEAKLHLAIVELYNTLRERFGTDSFRKVKLEDYLSLRGYYNNTVAGAAVVNQ